MPRWQDSLRARSTPALPSPDASLAAPSAPGTAPIVTVRAKDGRPQIDTRTFASPSAAERYLQQAKRDPQVLAAQPLQRRSLAEFTPVKSTTNETPSARSEPSASATRPENPTTAEILTANPTQTLWPKRPPTTHSPSTPSTNTPTAPAGPAATDPDLTLQWGLTALQATRVWAAPTKNLPITVAVIDTGVQANHPDLAEVVVPGHDFIDAASTDQTDPQGHGTHIAGVIAARANNGIGGAGLAQQVRIVPVRVLDASGNGTDADVARGILWAADHGAQVINLSLAATEYSAAEQAAVAYAQSAGVIVVAAAGNLHADGNPTVYPANYPGVVGVGATDQSTHPAEFSNTGPYVDLMAPGVNIYSTDPNGYAWHSGTSMAAAFASASMAVIRSHLRPTLTPQQQRSITIAVAERTAKDLFLPGRDDRSGSGLIQPAEALAAGGSSSSAVHVRWSVSASTPVRFRMPTTLTYRLTSTYGSPISRSRIHVCVAVDPDRVEHCWWRRTDAHGRFSVRTLATGTITTYARTDSLTPSTSPLTKIMALPILHATGQPGALKVQLAPVGVRVAVQQQTHPGVTRWRTIRSIRVPRTGQVTISNLPTGTYRVYVPATRLTAAIASDAVPVTSHR